MRVFVGGEIDSARSVAIIYLDEAGNFIPGVGTRVSCGAALAVPESRSDGLFRAFATLIEPWDRANGGREVKGSALNEEQASAVITVAEQHDPLLVITAIDAGTHSDADIRAIIAWRWRFARGQAYGREQDPRDSECAILVRQCDTLGHKA